MSDVQNTTPEESSAAPEVPEVSTVARESEPDGGDDHLATVRVASLPPVPRPPPANRISFPPPLPSKATASANAARPSGTPRTDRRPSAAPRQSWLHSLLASGNSDSATNHRTGAAEFANRRTVGAVSGVVALGLIVAAIVVGLSGPPADSGLPTDVVAAVVIGHALMGVGMLWAGFVLLRMSERWFAGRLEVPPESIDVDS